MPVAAPPARLPAQRAQVGEPQLDGLHGCARLLAPDLPGFGLGRVPGGRGDHPPVSSRAQRQLPASVLPPPSMRLPMHAPFPRPPQPPPISVSRTVTVLGPSPVSRFEISAPVRAQLPATVHPSRTIIPPSLFEIAPP